MSSTIAKGRPRLRQAILVLLVVGLGLGSRSAPVEHLPDPIGRYAGDVLWALLVYLLIGLVSPRLARGWVALIALGVSFGVELSQLYQAEWINRIRSTRLGGLVLGFGFKWSDLLCYTLGCAIGYAAEFRVAAADRGKP